MHLIGVIRRQHLPTARMTASTPPSWISFDDLPHAHGGPVAAGRLRERPEDFRVDEIPVCAPDGEGEHLLVKVRKIDSNTEWVARRLASHAGIPVSAVGYAGLKDRHAVTTQWFSLHVGVHRDPDWSDLDLEGVEVLEACRHRRKLRQGALRGNSFSIRVRRIRGDLDGLEARFAQVRQRGVPNYFGAQRFGNREGNLYAAHALFTGGARHMPRHLKGLWLSAARSQLFNQVLARRVERRDWDGPLPGERMQLAGSHASFTADAVDAELLERCRGFDIHPSGPLWGAGEVLCGGEVAELERLSIADFQDWTAGLEAAGMRQERRPLRLPVSELRVQPASNDALEIGFELPAGAFATAVLRELVRWVRSDDALGERTSDSAIDPRCSVR
jgi:tRNA pseudouridine13 synthase